MLEIILSNLLILSLAYIGFREVQHYQNKKSTNSVTSYIAGAFDPLVDRVSEDATEVRDHVSKEAAIIKEHVTNELKKMGETITQLKGDINNTLQTQQRKTAGLGDVLHDFLANQGAQL